MCKHRATLSAFGWLLRATGKHTMFSGPRCLETPSCHAASFPDSKSQPLEPAAGLLRQGPHIALEDASIRGSGLRTKTVLRLCLRPGTRVRVGLGKQNYASLASASLAHVEILQPLSKVGKWGSTMSSLVGLEWRCWRSLPCR